MKINVAQSAGFCFGVRRALTIANETAQDNRPVVMLGDIVHNEEVVRQIQRRGIKKVARLSRVKNTILLMRAHGASLATFARARKLGYHIVDATCPMVKEIHSIAHSMEKRKYTLIVVGDKSHDEVRGIVGQLKTKALVIGTNADLRPQLLKRIPKAAVVVQSTQDIKKVEFIVGRLRKHIGEVKFFNTICRPTALRQEEIRQMAQANDIIIIIGSKTSANTKRLYQISSALNPRTHWVQSERGLQKRWFRHAASIGVSSGASTPDSVMHAVLNAIKGLTQTQ